MLSATQIIYSGAGHKIAPAPGACRLCGGPYIPTDESVSSNSWTDEMLCRDLSENDICAACVWLRKNRSLLWKWNSDKANKLLIAADPNDIISFSSIAGMLNILKEHKFPRVIIARGKRSDIKKQIVLRSLDAVTYSPQDIRVSCFNLSLLNPPAKQETGLTGVAEFPAEKFIKDTQFLIDIFKPEYAKFAEKAKKSTPEFWFRIRGQNVVDKKSLISDPYGLLLAHTALSIMEGAEENGAS
jgi:hypothetical protein